MRNPFRRFLSLDCMIRKLRFSCARAVCVLGLLLVTQLAYAGQLCLSVVTVARTIDAGLAQASEPAGDCCSDASAESDLCGATEFRLELASPGVLPSVPCFPVAAGASFPESVRPPAIEARFSPSLTPGEPPPVHILLHRYLS